MTKRKVDSAYVCTFLEDTEQMDQDVVIAVGRTLQRAKQACIDFYDEMNSVYPCTFAKPEKWAETRKQDYTIYHSDRFFIQKFELL